MVNGLSISGVSKQFTNPQGEVITALSNVDLDIAPGSFISLIGPSGCGKSTLLRLIAGLIQPDSGTLTLDGAPITKPGSDRGFMFQDHTLFPWLTIYDNIAYGPRLQGIRAKVKLDEIVETSLRGAAIWDEVKDRLNKSALGLSGGQQQRLCIARALAVEPKVLLMDEPTSALDPISTSKIEELASELKKNYTIIMVTHNMQQAARISDKTAFFLLGKMIEFDSTEQLFSMPKDKRTEDYITGRFG